MASMIPYGSNYDRALRRAFDPFGSFFSDPFGTLASVANDGAFKMNVEDAGDAYVVTAELSGVKRDEIDVELNEGRLSISVDKKESEEEKGKNYLHKETSEWSATRGVYLKDADTTGLTAQLKDGVLAVNVPKKRNNSDVQKIEIA